MLTKRICNFSAPAGSQNDNMAIIKSKSNDDWRNKRSQEKRLFTSSLSVNEFVLTRAERIAPLGQVTGNCSYHVGWPPMGVHTSMELVMVSRAHNHAWRLALSRLQAEAHTLGAQGVVGVTLNAKPSFWDDRMLEVSVQGTAIRWQGAKATAAPFVSALSGQEIWALLSAGYRPVGVAYGTCVYQQVTTQATQRATSSGLLNSAARINQELREYTSGFYESRRRAVRYMEDEARQLGAEGIVGVTIEKQIAVREVEVKLYEDDQKQKRKDLVVRFFVLGTAIAPFIEYQPAIHAVMPLSR